MPTIDELKAKQAAGETLTAEELEQIKTPDQPTDTGDGEDDFDKDRAMSTIKKLREFEKDAKAKLKKLEAIEKAEADRKNAELSEKERLEKELETVRPELETLRKQNQTLLAQANFDRTARDLKLEFASTKAQETGYKLLDAETLGDDGAGMKDALLKLQKDHAYLFARIVVPETDAQSKGKTNPVIIQAEAKTRKRASYGAL